MAKAEERAVIRAGAVVGLAVIGDALLYAVLPSRYAEFGVPAHLVGVLLGANRLVRIVFNALAGRLYARAGRAWPFFLGSVLATGTTGLMAFLPGFWLLLGIRVVWGGSWSLLRLGGYMTVLEAAGVGRGRALGIFWSVVRAGMLAGTIGGAALVDAAGLRTTLLVMTAVTACSVLLAAPGERWQEQVATQDDRLSPSGRSATAVRLGPPSLRPRQHREAAVSVCAALQAFVTNGLIAATLGFALLQRLGEQVTLGEHVLGVVTITGTLLGLQRVTELVLGPVFGGAADRFGRAPVLLAGLVAAVIAALALLGAREVVSLGLAVAGYWLGATAVLAALDAAAADLAHEADGAPLLARYATWSDSGSALGPLVAYALAAPFGLAPLYGSAAALLALCAVVYVLAFPPHRPGEQEAEEEAPAPSGSMDD